MTQLAESLGISTTFIKRMKYAGFKMPGGVAMEAWALKWLEDHPQFRQKDYLRPPARPLPAPRPDAAHQAE